MPLIVQKNFSHPCLFLFAYEYCHGHLSDNNLLTHSTETILIKSSFWRRAHVDYWQMNQHNDILQIPDVKAKIVREKAH